MTTGLVTALPHREDQDLIDRIIGEQAGRPGALLGILEKLQEHNRAQVPADGDARVRGRAHGRPPVAGLQRRHVLRPLQPRAAGHAHGGHLPRHRLPHPRLAGAARAREAAARPARRTPTAPTSSPSPRPTGRFTIRTVACFGQCALAPVVEVDHAIRGHVKEQALMREVERAAQGDAADDDPGHRRLLRRARGRPRQAAARAGRASPSAWAPAAPATAPRPSTTPSRRRSTPAAWASSSRRSAASASAPRSRWSTSGCPAGRC